MGHKKRKGKRGNHNPVIKECLQERKKARSLGYSNAEEYEKGLSVIKRLLAKNSKEQNASISNK